jgi:hypothetical protein
MTLRRIDQARIEQALAGYEAAIRDAFLEAIANHATGIDVNALAEALERGDIEGAAQIATISRAVLYPVDAAIVNAFIASGTSIVTAKPVWAATFGFDGRATEAEQWARNHVGGLITEIVNDQRTAIREVLSDNIGAGINTRKAALEIAGRVGASGRREGGLIGLNGEQVRAVKGFKASLSSDLGVGISRIDDLPDGGTRAVKSFWIGKDGKLQSTYTLRDKRFDGIIMRAIRSGKPLSQVDIDRITARYSDRALMYRANMIARTESITALREGRRQGIKQAIAQGAINPDRVTREWDSSGDRRVRRDHVIMDGKRVTGMDEPYLLPDGSRMLYPGDTSLEASARQTVQCRCTERFVVDWLRP